MTQPPSDGRPYAPATLRNRAPILAVLTLVLPPSGTVLEIASGTGEHVVWLAERLPYLTWQPSEPDPVLRAAVAERCRESAAGNLLPPIAIDAARDDWGVVETAAIVCINMIHVAPWSACEGLLRGAGRILPPAAPLYLYGPFKRAGRHTAPSNEAFDASLRRHDPAWGVRDVDEVTAAAARQGLSLAEVVEMPANNLSVIFRKD